MTASLGAAGRRSAYVQPNLAPPCETRPLHPSCGRLSFGILSFSIAAYVGSFLVYPIVIICAPDTFNVSRFDELSASIKVPLMLAGLVLFVTPVLNCLGVLLGFMGLFQASQRKFRTVLSMLVNGVIPLLIAGLVILGAISRSLQAGQKQGDSKFAATLAEVKARLAQGNSEEAEKQTPMDSPSNDQASALKNAMSAPTITWLPATNSTGRDKLNFYDFQIALPTEWQMAEYDPPQHLMAAFRLRNGKSIGEIMIAPLNSSALVEAGQMVSAAQGQSKLVKLLESGKFLTKEGREGYLVLLQIEASDPNYGAPIYFYSLYLPHPNGRSVTFKLRCGNTEFDTLRAEFEAMIKNAVCLAETPSS